MENGNRILYFDLLRAGGAVAVVMIHVSCQFSGEIDVYSKSWMWLNIYGAIIRWTVPIFIMVSGACFLGKNKSVSHLLQRNVPHILIPFLLWSCIYAGIDVFKGNLFGIQKIIAQVIFGHYHMWFLYMIFGLYLIIPLLEAITEKEESTMWFLMLGFFFNFAIPWLYMVVGKFSGTLVGAVCSAVNYMNIKLVIGYSFYFVLGYFLHSVELSRKRRIVIYIIGIIGAVGTILLSQYASFKSGELDEEYYDFLSLNVCVQSIAIFVIAKYASIEKEELLKTCKIVAILSDYSFGVYLCHPMILEFLNTSVKFNSLSFNPAFCVPLLTVTVFSLSVVLVGVMKRIPLISEYMV